MHLPASRFLNLVQRFFETHLDDEARVKFLEVLDQEERAEEPPEKRRVPSWWKGDTAAANSMLAAARQFGLQPTGG